MPIPQDKFVFFSPHAYVALGAPYNGDSPWLLRSGVLEALLEAQKSLASQRPGWKIMVFDGYRPNAVQEFMVMREFRIQAEAANFDPDHLTESQQEQLAEKVYRLFGIPSENPATPPPHSTGAAVDCTLADESGKEVDMGSPIDENSDRSNPNHFAEAEDAAGKKAHQNRILLHDIMQANGFLRHHAEWWHFSTGDQYWAWTQRQQDPASQIAAHYGRADFLKKPAKAS